MSDRDYVEEERRMLLEQIARLRLQHEQQLAPYFQRLVRIEQMRPPSPYILQVDDGGPVLRCVVIR